MVDPALPQTLSAWLDELARRAPGRPALVAADGNAIPFDALRDRARGLAADLVRAGVGPGARLALALPPGPGLALGILALASRWTCMPLDPGLTAPEAAARLAVARLDGLVAGDGTPAPLLAAARALGLAIFQPGEAPTDPAAPTDLPDLPEPADSDIALVLTTSGTTALPKRVPLTHRALLLSARTIAAGLALSPADLGLCVMPLFHGHGLIGGLLAPLCAGSPVMVPGRLLPAELCALLARHRATWYSAVPTLHAALLAALDPASGAACRLRFVRSCSASLAPDLARRLEAAFRAPVLEAYGMTEGTHQIASNPLPPRPRRLGSVGPATGTELRVVAADGTPLPADQPGEVEVRGPALFAGYEDDPAATAAAHRDGWFRTGDLGRLDPDGYLTLVGRSKEMINRAGEKIAPREVEEALLAHPAVREAAAFPVPHPTLGEVVGAAVVLGTPAPGEAELQRFLAGRLAPSRIPARIAPVEAIPKGPSGKVRRSELARVLGFDRPAEASPGNPDPMLALWRETLRQPDLAPGSRFLAAGGDSLSGAVLLAAVAERFGVRLAFADLFEAADSPDSMADLVATRVGSPEAPGPAPHTAPGTLHPSELRMYVLDRIEGPGALAVGLGVEILGPLDVGPLEAALERLAARHPALRTRFPSPGGTPRREVGPATRPSLPIALLDHPGPLAGSPALAQVYQAELASPLDLETGPLVRYRLVGLGVDRHLLLVTAHHAVLDGLSKPILVRDLAAAYAAVRAGEAPGEPFPLRPGAVDPAALAEAEAYWRTALDGLDPGPFLAGAAAADEPAGPGPTRPRLELSLAQDGGLLRLARAHGCTPFMALAAVWLRLLAEESGRDDVWLAAVGSDREAGDEAIGCRINTLILRADLSGRPGFPEVLLRVRRAVLEASRHRALPIEAVLARQRALRARGPGTPFELVLSLEPALAPPLAVGGASFSRVELPPRQPLAGLLAEFRPDGDGLRGSLDAGSPGWTPTALAGLGARLEALCREAGRGLELPWKPRRPDPPPLPLPPDWPGEDPFAGVDLGARLAARWPAAPGTTVLLEGRTRVTGHELSGAAAALAGRLAAAGVGPGDRIALVLPRGRAALEAMLASLATGACSAHLDPADPPGRLARLLGQLRPRALVAGPGAALPGLPPGTVRLEHPVPAPAPAGPPPPPAPRPDPDRPSFVLFTSGSTGRPKGILSTPRAVLARAAWMDRHFPIRPDEVACWKVKPGLVDTLPEIFGALLAGIPLAIAPPAMDRDPAALLELLAEQAVTRIQLTPTLLRALLELEPALGHRLPRLGLWISTGEPLPPGLAEAVLAAHPGATLLDLYDSTESYGHGLLATRRAGEARGRGPAFDTQVAGGLALVLDPVGAPAAPGAEGEVCFLGANLSPGELDDPAGAPGRARVLAEAGSRRLRLHPTGDRGRTLADGRIELLGRIDHELKVGGFRIHPAEVEACLLALPGVGEAAVFPAPRPDGGTRLEAAAAPAPGAHLDADLLRAGLLAVLPAPLVPAPIAILPALPRTPAGKIDRVRLAAGGSPAPTTAPGPAAPAAPPGDLAALLAADCARVLGTPGFAPDDDFFARGGTSLLAVGLLAELGRRLGRRVPFLLLAKHPTPAGLAAALGSDPGDPARASLVTARAAGTHPPLFCFEGLFGHVGQLVALYAGDLGEGFPVHGLQPPGMDWAGVGCTSLADMARWYLAVIRGVQPRGPYHLLGASFGGVLAYQVALQLEAAGETIGLLAMLDSLPARVVARFQLPRPEESAAPLPVLDDSRRVAEAHLRAARLSPPPGALRGRIDFFFCERARPAPELDPRLEWAALAAGGFAVVPLDALHVQVHHSEPRARVVAHLRARLQGQPGSTVGPAELAGGFRPLALRHQLGLVPVLAAPDGTTLPIVPWRSVGHVDRAWTEGPMLVVTGWATTPAGDRPADALLLVHRDRGVFWGTSGGVERPDVAAARQEPGLRWSGFYFRVELPDLAPADLARLRLFSVGAAAARELYWFPARNEPSRGAEASAARPHA